MIDQHLHSHTFSFELAEETTFSLRLHLTSYLYSICNLGDFHIAIKKTENVAPILLQTDNKL
jgi:hypothetical protein